MDNEGLMIFIFQAIIALFAFFVVAPCVLNAVSLFTVQKRFAKTMIDLGDRVTCINKNWKIKINVRITEVSEVYQQGEESLEITFGESLPALIDKIRQIAK